MMDLEELERKRHVKMKIRIKKRLLMPEKIQTLKLSKKIKRTESCWFFEKLNPL